MEQKILPETHANPVGPVGIGGWLILPILGLVGSIGLTIKNLSEISWVDINLIFTSDIPEVLDYRLPLILSFLSAAFVIFFASIALVQIFRRSRHVPTIMTIFYTGLIIVTLVEMAGAHMTASMSGEPPISMAKELARAIIIALVWVPYFHRSKRVKNTFRAAN